MHPNDERAAATFEALIDVALSVRDDGPDDVHAAARAVLDAADGDPVAAVVVAAALIRVDRPIDAWWQRGLAGVGAGLRPHPSAPLRDSGGDLVDEEKIQRVMRGDRQHLTIAERREAIVMLAARGFTQRRIARLVGCAGRTVERHLAEARGDRQLLEVVA